MQMQVETEHRLKREIRELEDVIVRSGAPSDLQGIYGLRLLHHALATARRQLDSVNQGKAPDGGTRSA